ncbi:MAG TPA: hypothetical protein PKA74_08795 [Bauldia sp.]|nr:hypothetical protein [Bauldia sp.]
MKAGDGVLLIWNDIAAGSEAAFRAWHDEEHIPERMGVPGFLHGRRFFGAEAAPRWLTVYEAEAPSVFSSAPYRARLDRPSPRTSAILPSFRATERMAGHVVAATGWGRGPHMAAVRLRLPDGASGLEGLLDRLRPGEGLVSAAVVAADMAGTAVRTAEKDLRTGDRDPPDAALLIEAADPEAALLAAASILPPAGDAHVAVDRYRLEFGPSAAS